MCVTKAPPRFAGRPQQTRDVEWVAVACNDDQQVFGRSGPITVLTSPFAAVSAAATAEAAAAAAAAEAAEDKGMEMIACGVPTGQESSSDVSHQTNGLALGRVTRAQSQTGARMPVSYVELHTGAPLVSAIDIAEPAALATESQGHSDDAEEDLQPKKKKVGRPIAYKGDINSPHLTEAERRRIKRRVANRESARRVRQKRQETMEELQLRMSKVKEENAALASHLTEVQSQKQELQAQLARLQDEWSAANSNNLRLMEEVSTKRNSLQTMTCPTVATVLTSSMDQDNLVAAARSAATAVTSGIRNSLSTLSSGGTGGFRPGAVVTTSGTHYAMGGNLVGGGAVVTGSCHVGYPAAIQDNHASVGGGHPAAVKAEPVNRGAMRPVATTAAPPAGMPVPDICRAPTACAFNIVGSFGLHGHGAKPRLSGPATPSAADGFTVPTLNGQPSDSNDFLFRFPSNKDPLDMLLLSEQSLDQLTSGF